MLDAPDPDTYSRGTDASIIRKRPQLGINNAMDIMSGTPLPGNDSVKVSSASNVTMSCDSKSHQPAHDIQITNKRVEVDDVDIKTQPNTVVRLIQMVSSYSTASHERVV